MPVNDVSQRQEAAAARRLRDQIRAVAERANGGVCEKGEEGGRRRERVHSFFFLRSEQRFSLSLTSLSLSLLPSNRPLSLSHSRARRPRRPLVEQARTGAQRAQRAGPPE